jgi:hypothetical protein
MVRRNGADGSGVKKLLICGVGNQMIEVFSLNFRSIALSLILAISLISGLSAAEDSNVSMDESDVQPGDLLEPTITEAADVAAASDAMILEGSWILNLDDLQISMVIRQSEDLLFGAANSETPEPWNGVVSGSLDEDAVEIEILSLQDGVLVSTLVSGTAAADGTIRGQFVQSDSMGKVNTGSAIGFLTSPDTSGYEPADVPTTVATATAEAVTTPVLENTTTTSESTETTSSGRKTPVDVTTLADQYYAVGAGVLPAGV